MPTEVPPPKAPAQPVRIDQPEASVRSTRPSALVASSTTGTPACRAASAAAAYGWIVPTSWFATCRHAAAVPGAATAAPHSSRSRCPCPSTATATGSPLTAAALSTEE